MPYPPLHEFLSKFGATIEVNPEGADVEGVATASPVETAAKVAEEAETVIQEETQKPEPTGS